MNTEKVVLIGGGPVGLLLGLSLHKKGIPFTILEKRTEGIHDSRSLGIHPVSLCIFDDLEISEAFLREGLKVRGGIAHSGKRVLGRMSFSLLPPPHPYVLLLPQSKTEMLLKSILNERAPGALVENAEFIDLNQHQDHVSFSFTQNGTTHTNNCELLLACDGKKSVVRQQLGLEFVGSRYPDTYIMGDFDDVTDFGDEAVLFLHKHGLIESFPLPHSKRRWVIKTDTFEKNATAELLCNLVQERTNISLESSSATMISGFGVQHFMAEKFVKNRVVLLGDAAHVVSPIGGQGMNLGWIDAWNLAQVIGGVLKNSPATLSLRLAAFEKRQQAITRTVASRAAWNMKMGRRTNFPILKYLLVQVLLHPPFKKMLIQRFTMHHLE